MSTTEPLPPLPDQGPTDGEHGTDRQDVNADPDDELDAEPDTTDFDAEQDKRADQPGGALSPGTTATGSPTGRE